METVATAANRPNHKGRTMSVEALIRDTHHLLAAAGIGRSPAWVSRTARTYARSTGLLPYGVWLASRVALSAEQRAQVVKADPGLGYRLGYADPTATEAIRNVTRGRR